jgi:hypothetical protein
VIEGDMCIARLNWMTSLGEGQDPEAELDKLLSASAPTE